MAPKRKLCPSSEGAGPSRPAKSRELTFSFPENTTEPFILEMRRMADEIDELKVKVDELEWELHVLKNPTILDNPIDENQTTREPANHGRYELKIMNNIKKRVYTGSEVQGQDGELLKVAIYDNGQKITSRSFDSAKCEVLILKASSTSDKFQESLAEARTEVGPILAQACISQFSNGEAVLEDLKFKDNSNWAPEKKWRLGIRIVENFNVKIHEAISDPFRVLDRHGKASEKPDTPLLEDGVERLQKVGNKRALALKANQISTVKDFLQLYHENPTHLREILGIKSDSDESWITMIRHAEKCDTGSDLFPDDPEQDIRRDADQNITTDHNTTQFDHFIPGPELPHAFQDEQIDSVSVFAETDPADFFWIESPVLDPGSLDVDSSAWLATLLGEQPASVDTPSVTVRRNPKARRACIWLVMRFVFLHLRRGPVAN